MTERGWPGHLFVVITGLVPVIHVLALLPQQRRGWPGHRREAKLRRLARPTERGWPGHLLVVITGLVPVIHVLALLPQKGVDGRDIGAKQSFVASPGHDEGGFSRQLSNSHTSAISPRMCASLAGRFARLKIRGRRECRALDAPAASHAK